MAIPVHRIDGGKETHTLYLDLRSFQCDREPKQLVWAYINGPGDE
jgi:hypothetical protein